MKFVRNTGAQPQDQNNSGIDWWPGFGKNGDVEGLDNVLLTAKVPDRIEQINEMLSWIWAHF